MPMHSACWVEDVGPEIRLSGIATLWLVEIYFAGTTRYYQYLGFNGLGKGKGEKAYCP